MKKLLLSALSVLAFGAMNVDAQVQKMPFVEHFTQASCGPCASQNPTMYATLNTFGAGNYVKLTYQTSWPGTDPMNAEYANGPASRVTYYGVGGVPDASLSGGATAAPNTAVTAATLAAKAAETTPYAITITHTWNNGDIDVAIDVTNTTGASVSTADRIYVSMIEDHIPFGSAPGSNGETDFYYVNRMFYNASTGAEMNNATNNNTTLGAIAGGATTSFSFTVTGANIPAYIRDMNELSFVCFIQNNSTNEVEQAAMSVSGNVPGLLDVASAANSTVGTGYCNLAFTPEVNFTNNGSIPVTTVTAEYTINGGTAVSQTYNTAPINQGQTQAITFPATNLAAGSSTVQYAITDVNSGGVFSGGPNNMPAETYAKLNAAGTAAPLAEGMESAPLSAGTGYSRTPVNAIFDVDASIPESSYSILDGPTYNYGTIGGFGNSNRSIRFRFYSVNTGVMKLAMQKVNLGSGSEVTFNTAYRQYQAENDRLEVHVSTDCGANWTSVFNEAGTTLAHGLAASTTQYVPNANGSEWYAHTVSLAAFDNTNDVIVRFTGTSAYGNNLFLDDINIQDVNGVAEVSKNASNVEIMPNPVRDNMTVKFTSISDNASIVIRNVQGQLVKTVAHNTVIGDNNVAVRTSDLPAGMYTLSIVSDAEATTKRFVVNK